MGIFQNEAIRSLPEQVEKNKEDIKNINDILENIDPDQVATILSDIASLQAEQVTQNLAIGSNASNISNNTTAINNEKTAREDVVGVNVAGNTYLKTATPNKQILINNDGIISLTSSNFVEVLANNHVRLATDNTSVKADENNGVIIEVDGDNPKTLTLKPNGEFEVSNGHILKFDTTGSITIDGQPIGGGGGGGTPLYQHNITFGNTNYPINFSIINREPNSYTNSTFVSCTASVINTLCTALLDVNPLKPGYTASTFPVTGLYESGTSFNYSFLLLVFASSITYKYLNASGSVNSGSISSSSNVCDIVSSLS